MNTLIRLWKLKELRNSILTVLAMLVLFRFTAHIPIPGVNATNLAQFFRQNELFGLLNVFSGGGLEQFSVVAMGVAPYITASIIFQLLTMIVPKLEELSKEGEYGRQKINQYTRFLTVPLALLQSYGLITLLQRSSASSSLQIFPNLTNFQLVTMMLTLTGGTMFLMWLGELVSEKNVGNGISLLIFAGIISTMFQDSYRALSVIDSSQYVTALLFVVIGIVTIVGVVYMSEGQRNVPVSYAKVVRGNRLYGGVNTHLPLRVNQAGVIPIIFAISIILFPPTIAQFLTTAKSQWIVNASNAVVKLFENQLVYGVLYFVLVVAFTYFYTAIVFQPDQISENLQKQGGFVPGIRPGKPTAEYLQFVINRILLAGSLFLGLIAILPIIVRSYSGITAISVGGTSLLIVVSVVIETVKQVQSQLTMREYEGF